MSEPSQDSPPPRRDSSSRGQAHEPDDFVDTIVITSRDDRPGSERGHGPHAESERESAAPGQSSEATLDPADGREPGPAGDAEPRGERGKTWWALAGRDSEISLPSKLIPGRIFSPGRQAIDPWLFFATVAITCLGLVMVYSSSAWASKASAGLWEYRLQRQAVFMAVGMLVMVLAMRMDYRLLRRYSPQLMLVALGSLAAVLVFGTEVNGAKRWFRVAGLGIQPSEFAKIALAAFLAATLARQGERVRSFARGFVPPMLAAGITMALVLGGRDLGTTFLLGCLTLVMLFVAGTRLSYVMAALLLAAPIIWSRIVNVGYRSERLMQFLANEDYQVQQSLIAIGSGGAWGRGLGLSRQKLGFLPECHTDFILAVIGEELGLWGMGIILGLYALIVWRGMTAARDAPDRFGAYLAAGITATIGIQALINMAVVFQVIPAKGITLPFVSYGGSSLIVSLASIGIVLGISRRPIPCKLADQRVARPPGAKAPRAQRKVPSTAPRREMRAAAAAPKRKARPKSANVRRKRKQAE